MLVQRTDRGRARTGLSANDDAGRGSVPSRAVEMIAGRSRAPLDEDARATPTGDPARRAHAKPTSAKEKTSTRCAPTIAHRRWTAARLLFGRFDVSSPSP